MVGLDSRPGADTESLGSVADRTLIDRLFADHGIEAVVHAGALHKPDIVRYPAQAFVDVNVTGTLNLLEAAAAAGHDRFVFTSTTSLMISEAIRAGKAGGASRAAWLDEDFGPLEPRNIYGVTKLAAEQLCRLAHREHGVAVDVLRTGRFFPEEDDTHRDLSGQNIKANEFLNRRLTVEDAADAHVAALAKAPEIGFGTFILSAPPPFARGEAEELIRDAPAVIARHFPDAAELYARAGWTLPDAYRPGLRSGRAERVLGFRCRTDFAAMLRRCGSGKRIALRPRSRLCLARSETQRSKRDEMLLMTQDRRRPCPPWLGAAAAAAPGAGRSPAELSLWRLDCGEFVIKQYGAFFSDTFQYPAGPKRIVGSCYLIRHGNRYMLWDTGLADALVGNPVDNAAPTITRPRAASSTSSRGSACGRSRSSSSASAIGISIIPARPPFPAGAAGDGAGRLSSCSRDAGRADARRDWRIG